MARCSHILTLCCWLACCARALAGDAQPAPERGAAVPGVRAFSYAQAFPVPGEQCKELGIANDGLVPSSLISEDFNRDGLPDLAVAYAFGDQVRWFKGQAGGTFALGGSLDVGTKTGAANDLPRQLLTGDFDADGFIDLLVVCSGLPPGSGSPYLTNAPSLGILYGRPGGFEAYRPCLSFSGSASTSPKFALRAAPGFFSSEDREPGLAVGFAYSRQVALLRCIAGRQFDNPQLYNVNTTGEGPYAVLAVDLLRSGAADLLLVNQNDVQLWRNDGSQSFGTRFRLATGSGFTAARLADFDDNGAWDLAIADGAADKILILMNLGPNGHAATSGTLQLAAGSGPIDLSIGDVNLDGREDLSVISLNGSPGGQAWLNQFAPGVPAAAVQFVPAQTIHTSRNPRALALIDVNGDQLPDFATANEGDKNGDTPANEDVTFTLNVQTPPRGDRVVGLPPLAPGAQIPPYLDRPAGLGWDATRQALWCIDRRAGDLICLQTSGTLLQRITLASLGAGLIDPQDVAVDAAGQVWLLDGAANRLVRVQPGSGVTANISLESQGFQKPAGLAFDAAANRLLVGDELQSRLVSFSPVGQRLKTYATTEPLRDLAWDAAGSRLWAVAGFGDGGLLVLIPNEMDATFTSERPPLSPDDLAPLLFDTQIKAVAVQGGADGHLAALTSGGALLEITGANSVPTLVHIRELRLLRELRDIVRLPEQHLLLADGGVLATLAEIDAAGTIQRLIQLNHLESGPDIEICGLAAGLGFYFVLDGRGHGVRVYTPDGQPRGMISGLPLGEHRLRGLFFSPTLNRLSIGAEGRVLEVQLTVTSNGQGVSGTLLEEHPIPATRPPGSLGRGPDPGQLALFDPQNFAFPVFHADWSLVKWITQVSQMPADFNSLAGLLPVGNGEPGYLVGEGPYPLVPFTLTSPGNAVQVWDCFE